MLIRRARLYAISQHKDQRYGNEPYVVHLGQVVDVLKRHHFSAPDLIAAAWLHDVVEDTGTPIEEIRLEFGDAVANLVWAVTGIGTNRTSRNADMYEKLKLNPYAIVLKLADRIANVETSKPGSSHRAMYEKEWQKFYDTLHGVGGETWANVHRPLWETLIDLLVPRLLRSP